MLDDGTGPQLLASGFGIKPTPRMKGTHVQQVLQGQVAIVSGSSTGLGKAYAEWLAARGANVIINGTSDRVQEAVEGLSTMPGQAHGIRADVGEFSACREIVERTLEKWGRIDILVNNAGNEPSRFDRVMSELDARDLEAALRVNVYGAYNLTLAAWNALKERRNGRVIFIGSGHMFGSYGDLGLIPQAAAKAAVVGLTRSFACVGRTNGIRVNAVFPAALDTGTNRGDWNLSSDEVEELGRLAPASMVAPVVGALVDGVTRVTGEMFSVCNRNVTRVFVGDTAAHDYTAHNSVEACLKACLEPAEYRIPQSIGEFFSLHLDARSLERLSAIQQRHRRISTEPRQGAKVGSPG